MSAPAPHLGLVEQASRGDATALGGLFQRYLPGLLAFVRLRASPELRARDSTLDLVQSACREVLKDLPAVPIEDEAAFKRWLYLAAERKVVDRARFHRRERRDVGRERPFADDPSAEEVGYVGQAYASLCSPSRNAMVREDLDRVENAFRIMPDHYREVVLLARVIGLPHRDIGEMTGRSEGAVRILLHRALARLGTLLGPSPL